MVAVSLFLEFNKNDAITIGRRWPVAELPIARVTFAATLLATLFAAIFIAENIGTEPILADTLASVDTQLRIIVTVRGWRLITSYIVASLILSATSVYAGVDARFAPLGVRTEAPFVAYTEWLKQHELHTNTITSWRAVTNHTHTGIVLATSALASIGASNGLAIVKAIWLFICHGASTFLFKHDEVLLVLAIRSRRLPAKKLGAGRILTGAGLTRVLTGVRPPSILAVTAGAVAARGIDGAVGVRAKRHRWIDAGDALAGSADTHTLVAKTRMTRHLPCRVKAVTTAAVTARGKDLERIVFLADVLRRLPAAHSRTVVRLLAVGVWLALVGRKPQAARGEQQCEHDGERHCSRATDSYPIPTVVDF